MFKYLNEVIVAFYYAFRQATQYLLGYKSVTLGGNLDLFYLFPLINIKKIIDNKKSMLYLILLIILLSCYSLLQIAFIPQINILKLVINCLKIILCFSILLIIKNYKFFSVIKFAKIVSIIYIILTCISFLFLSSDIFWKLGDVVNKYDLQRLQLLYLEPSELGFHLIIIILILFDHLIRLPKNKSKYDFYTTLFFITTNLIILFFSKSMGSICFGILAFLLYILYILYKKYTLKKFLIVLSIFFVIGIIAFIITYLLNFPITLRIIDTFKGNDASNQFRVNVTINVLKESFIDYKFLGCGFGNMNTPSFMNRYLDLGLVEVFANSFLTFIVEGGIFSLIFLSILLFTLIRNAFQSNHPLNISLCFFVIFYQFLGGYFTSGLNWLIYGILLSNMLSDNDNQTLLTKKIPILFLHAGAELYGADIVMYNLINGLDKKKFDITVILPCDGPLVYKLTSIGIKVDVIEYPILRRKYMNISGALTYFYNYIKYTIYMIYKYRNEKFNIIHVNTSAVLEGIPISLFFNAKLIWHIHEIIEKPKFFNLFISKMCSIFADKVVVVSNAVKQHMLSSSKFKLNQIKVIYNGVDNKIFNTDPLPSGYIKSFGINADNIRIGMIGRVNSWKGQNDLLKAVDILYKKNYDFTTIFVGGVFDGEEWRFKELEEKILASPYSKKIILKNFSKDSYNIHKLFDIFVLPSTNPDPLPTVVLEAMATGKPIVGYAHGGICEMVKNKNNGLLANVRDVNDLASKIEKLLTDENKRYIYGKNSSQRQLALFSLDAYVNNFTHLYIELSNELGSDD